MSMISGIAATSIGMSSAQTLTDINVSLLGKVLDTAEIQGEALEQMMEVAAPDSHLLDVYA